MTICQGRTCEGESCQSNAVYRIEVWPGLGLSEPMKESILCPLCCDMERLNQRRTPVSSVVTVKLLPGVTLVRADASNRNVLVEETIHKP